MQQLILRQQPTRICRETHKQIERFWCERQGLPVPEEDAFVRNQGQRPELEARGCGFHAGIMGRWRLFRQTCRDVN